MKQSFYQGRHYREQQGVVLIAALMILLMLTLMALALVRLGVVELKVAGASQRYQILFNDAESMISHYLFSNQNSFSTGCLSYSVVSVSTVTLNSLPSSAAIDQCHFIKGYPSDGYYTFEANDGLSIVIPNIRTTFSRVNLRIEEMACIDNYFSQVGSGQANDMTAPSAVFFDISATAWDIIDTDASVVIHTGVIAQLPPGNACRAQGKNI